MGKEIKLKKSELMLTVEAIKTSKDEVDNSISGIDEPKKCSNIMIFNYYDMLEKISSLLNSYKELLEKDLVDIRVAVDHIEKTDKKIAGDYSSGTSTNTSSKKKSGKKKK